MRRKLLAALFCAALMLQLAVPAAAAGSVYFTAVNKNVLKLSDATMPFWSGGYLYVPSSIFTGANRDHHAAALRRRHGVPDPQL